MIQNTLDISFFFARRLYDYKTEYRQTLKIVNIYGRSSWVKKEKEREKETEPRFGKKVQKTSSQGPSSNRWLKAELKLRPAQLGVREE
jgi:hypothetical protein